MSRSTSAGTIPYVISPRDNESPFVVPMSWRSPTPKVSVEDATAYARAVADTLTPMIDPDTAQFKGTNGDSSATFMNSLALLDHKSENTYYRDIVTSTIKTAAMQDRISQPGGSGGAVEWGLAATRAHHVYNDVQLLDAAISLWNQANPYLVTQGNAQARSHPLRNVTISQTCEGRSIAGAVFQYGTIANNTAIASSIVGSFSALSASLFEVTSDPKYRSAADLSAEFLRRVMWDGTIIRDGIVLQSCDRLGDPGSFNTGKTLEALCIIATKNQSWIPFTNALVASSVQFPTWTSPDGVITEGSTSYLKGIWVRGLYDTWEWTSDDAMAQYIQAYLTVQFNALRDLALIPGTNYYSPLWTKVAPPTADNLTGQIAAIDALSSQIGFARARNAAASSVKSIIGPTATDAPSPTSTLVAGTVPHTNRTKVIAGCVCGGLFFVALAILGIWCIRRRRLRQGPHLDAPRPFSAMHTSVTRPPQKRLPPFLPADAAAGVVDGSDYRHLDGPRSSSLRSARAVRGSQNATEPNNETIEVRERWEVGDGSVPSTAPNVVELLHAMMERVAQEYAREPPPSYYTGP